MDSWIPSTTGSSLLSSCLSSVALPLVVDDDELVAELIFVLSLCIVDANCVSDPVADSAALLCLVKRQRCVSVVVVVT